MTWLEVQSHAGSSCPIISDGFPLLFTWKEELAEELSSCLLDRLPTIQHVASFLEVRLWVAITESFCNCLTKPCQSLAFVMSVWLPLSADGVYF